jgi:hypothetical protein
MDTILAIIGLALGLASLVPAFTSTGHRKKIVFIAVGVSLVGIFSFQLYDVFAHRRHVEELKEEITQRLLASGSMSFEQLLTDLYYPDFATANDAIDALVREGRTKHEVIDVQSASGVHYKVRIYYVIPPDKI